ncbi:prepilin peptidase [Marinobacter pelagius]|uniref:A24 family peptidase n=1 Tax=Marinobacter sp. C7 TaxID=2951363 RepID=UPI001EEFC47B|nr:prepilin peptidase [Marinobacter sp. C7]MCG7201680.1 prepilin peptidase [Marinobacter sp. C7]
MDSTSLGIATTLLFGLLAAVYFDFSSRRIPNVLTFSMIVLGITLHSLGAQWQGAGFALSGLLVGLFCFLPLYFFAALGAGDVKLLAAVGALIGPYAVFLSAVMTLLVGGVFALAFITWKGGLFEMARRYWSMFVSLAYLQPTYIAPAKGEAAGLRLPYAPAIACGTALSVLL